MTQRRLGKTTIEITPIGMGCWQFAQGGNAIGRFWNALSTPQIVEIVGAARKSGIAWFDTAEIYGNGSSERSLSGALSSLGVTPGSVVVATKWFPAFRTAASIRTTVGERLARLAPFGIDLHQIHQPIALATVAAQMRAMAELVAAGRIRTVGVSNFSAGRMRAAHRALATHGVPLIANQVRYSLLHRGIETNGVLDAARELGITIIAYSPLAQGVLSGKFHRDPGLIRARPGPRKWLGDFRRRGLERSRPVVSALEEIAAAHGATASQVALAWLLQVHGDVVAVIPGSTSVLQARENAGAAHVRLDGAELRRLDEVSRRFR
jgi:aryl-alcohol dehydrogenase-like predicted oxidoreductase